MTGARWGEEELCAAASRCMLSPSREASDAVIHGIGDRSGEGEADIARVDERSAGEVELADTWPKMADSAGPDASAYVSAT